MYNARQANYIYDAAANKLDRLANLIAKTPITSAYLSVSKGSYHYTSFQHITLATFLHMLGLRICR